jgi:ketosteroid isomerase-like protein
VVARYFRIWNDGDPSAVGELIASDWVDHSHTDRHTPADVERAIISARAAQPDLRVLVDAIIGDSGLITVNGRIETGSEIENWVWIVRVEDDRIHEMWTYSAD